MADLSSILGGMVQGFKDFGTGLVDMFGTGGAAIGDAIASIQSGRATTKNQDDFRKWLYNTDSTKDAAAKGLGTALNGVSTVADVIPGAQAVTANPLFNGIQGAIGGVADELKMAGENADLGRAAQRAGVGAASGLASGYAGQALGKSGNKLLSNGLTRGAVSGALGGGIANAGYTGIEGGSVQDMINAGLYGAQTGALVGGTTGLARELIKPNYKMDVALTDEEKAARIANIDDQLGKLDLNTPEGNARYNELMNARNNYANDEMLKLYRGISAPDDATLQRYIDDMKNPDIEPTNYSGGSAYGKGYYFTPDEGIARYYASESGLPSTAVLEIEVPKNRFTEINKANGNRPADFDLAAVKRGVPEDIRYETGLKDFNDYLDNNGYWGSKTSDDGTYTIMRNDAVLNAKKVGDTPKTVADLMAEKKTPSNVAELMYSKAKPAEGQLGLFDQPIPEPAPAPKVTAKASGEQASLFDLPQQIEEGKVVKTVPADAEPVNPYAPVDGQVTQAMRDRAAEVLKTYAKKGVPDNELYDMIDESTLPAGYKEFREIVDSGKSYAKEKLGAENANKADLRRVVEYLYDDTAKQEEMLRNVKVEESNDAARRAMYGLAPRKSGSSFSEKMLRRAADEKLTKEFAEKIEKIENRVPELTSSLRRYNPSDLSVRKGLTAAADELYSERLGIAPGNTIKYNGPADVRGAYGRYAKQSKNLALTRSNVSDPEQAISTIAHERLHSFQNEADLNRGKYGATNRYDKRVTDAFDELRKELQDSDIYKSFDEISDRYGRKDATYYASTGEQEARMLQQYLNNKGYTDLQQLKSVYTDKGRTGEFGNEVNAPFDKFFDKLRALSKKGVALPALTALFGGGAIMAATQGDDKKKKSEVK